MSAISPLPISSRITNPLKQVSQRQWTVLAARGILQTLVVSLAMLLAVSLLLGYLPGMPVALRIILAVIGWGTVVWVSVHSLRPALVRWSLSRAAQMAESSIADNQERISSAVELSQAEDQFRGSPELVNHLVKQAEQDVARVNVSMVVPFKTIGLWFLAFLPVLGLWMVFMMNGNTAQMVLRGLFSTLMPWKVPPAILADVDAKPGNVTVAQGDSVQIIGTVGVVNGSRGVKAANLVRTFASTGQSVSQILEETGPRQFSLNLDNLQQSFQYLVVTDGGKKSPVYKVTVNPRPAISRLDVRYEYPKYTGLDAKTLPGNDGNIDAVTGTKITLAIHTTDSLVLDKSQLIFNSGRQDEAAIPVTATNEKNVYEAKFDVARTGDYRIKLLNEYNLGNKDDDARAVTAEIDQAPTIAITSPQEQITVRPDDEVAVMYTASDDYGVAKVEVLLQVDDKPERTYPIVIHSKDHKSFKETWTLPVAQIIKVEGVAEAARISYQLKATDNRDPDAQTGLSARQTLLISKTEKKSFQDKLNEIRKDDLMALIKRAIERLTLDGVKVAGLRDYQARAALTADQLRLASGLRDHVSNTGKDLSLAAVDFFDTPFVDVAKAAKEVADKQIAKAADDTARISLNGADRSAGAEAAATAYKEIIEARTELEKLLLKAIEAAKKAEAVEALKDAAKKQEEVAKQMAEHPELQEQNLKKQQEAIAKLQEAFQKDQSLQNKEAVDRAKQLAELENKIEQDQKQQTDLQNQTAKQEEKQQAQEAANAIAEEQKKLNQEVQQFAKEDQKALDQAKAKTPDQAQQEALVKNIEKNELNKATEQAQAAADQLKKDAQKLAEQANKPDATAATPEQQKQQQQDVANQANAAKAEKQADQAAKDLKKEAAQPKPDANAAQQTAEATKKAAQQIQKQAEKIEQQNQEGAKNADVQKAAEAAKADSQQAAADAQAAQEAAKADKPQEAQQDAAKAAQEVAKAGQELAQAAQTETKANQAQAKADQAQAQQQNQQAAAKAGEKAQDLANKQQQIAQALAQQAQQQADAAQAPTPQQQAQQQQQVAQQTQDAQKAAQQLAQQAEAQKDNTLQQRAAEAAKALEQAAKDQQQAAAADAANKPADAAQAQADAQKALAKADQALRGNPEQAQAQANAADPAKPDAAQQGQPEAGKPEQGQGQPEAGKPEQGQGQPEQGQGQPQQTAAQAAQEAAQAQQQALQPNPAAAAEAAQALAQAAQAAQQGLPGQEQGQPGNEPGTEPGEHPGEHPHPAADPKMGIAGSENGGNNKVPGSVAALGISASDWAKLPPLMQRQLMNASQQSGPVAYKEMIKNYYIRVAKMQTEQGAK